MLKYYDFLKEYAIIYMSKSVILNLELDSFMKQK